MLIKNTPDNIIKNLSKKKYVVRDFWINFDLLGINYKKSLCSIKKLQKTIESSHAKTLGFKDRKFKDRQFASVDN